MIGRETTQMYAVLSVNPKGVFVKQTHECVQFEAQKAAIYENGPFATFHSDPTDEEVVKGAKVRQAEIG